MKDGSKEDDPDNLHTISLDATDAGCQSCAPVIRSDSLLSSTDNEIDPAISLNMKKSNIVYKGINPINCNEFIRIDQLHQCIINKNGIFLQV